jgi:uncharacterized protein with FMN-binding domain
MRRVALTLIGTVTGLVMLLSFKTHSLGTTASTPAVAGPGAALGHDGASTGTSTAPAAPSTASSAARGAATKTVTGDESDTRYGPVQVQVTVTNGAVTAVNATEYPENDPRDEQINSYAIPQLNSEALAAKSAHIDMVSGATYTSDGYISSLQSALDKAGL